MQEVAIHRIRITLTTDLIRGAKERNLKVKGPVLKADGKILLTIYLL
uniref:Uncharacterized protein n=1 Tax=Salvator merianae TaxID=96440 RepID=A0A8D0C3E2_SALMN